MRQGSRPQRGTHGSRSTVCQSLIAVLILSDMPLAAAVAIGLYQRMTDPTATSGRLMLGGALSFSGQHGVGGWAAANAHRMWPVSIDAQEDAVEAPGGLTISPAADCPRDLAQSLAGAPRVFGYNRVAAALGASTLATFSNGGPWRSPWGKGDRRSAVYTSDLMPHWGAAIASWDGLPGLLRALVGSSRRPEALDPIGSRPA